MTIRKTHTIIAILCLIVGAIIAWWLKPSSIIQTTSGVSGNGNILTVKRDTVIQFVEREPLHYSGHGSLTFGQSGSNSSIETSKMNDSSAEGLPCRIVLMDSTIIDTVREVEIFNQKVFTANGFYCDTVRLSQLPLFILTMPFNSEYTGINGLDTVNVKYEFPSNKFSCVVKPRPDKIVTINTNTEIEKPLAWYRSNYAIGAYTVAAFIFGVWVGK